MSLQIGDKVKATITEGGYWKGSYQGTVTGFTSNGRVKVSDGYRVRVHAAHNVNKVV